MRTPIKYHPINVPFNNGGVWYKFIKARVEMAGMCYSETGESCIFIKNSPCGYKNECHMIARPDRLHTVIVRCTPSGNKPENGHILIHNRYKKILKKLGVFNKFLKGIRDGLDKVEKSEEYLLRKELKQGRQLSCAIYFLIIKHSKTIEECNFWNSVSLLIRRQEKQPLEF